MKENQHITQQELEEQIASKLYWNECIKHINCIHFTAICLTAEEMLAVYQDRRHIIVRCTTSSSIVMFRQIQLTMFTQITDGL